MKNGLVLSGGGARGFAHLGVLQALDELEVRVDIIAGTSAGAVAGAFYSAGHKPVDTMRYIRSYKTYEWLHFLWRKPGFLNMQKIAAMLSKFLPDTFEGLNRPLIVTATDLLHGEARYFSEGPLLFPLCASACIPILFEPMPIDGSVFVDGGILNNFPLEPLEEKVTNIIGVHVNPIDKTLPEIHFKDVMDRSMHLALSQTLDKKKKMCSVFIEPMECSKTGILDLGNAEKLFEVGYKEAMLLKDELLKFR